MSTGRGDLADDEPVPPGKAGPATGAMRLRRRAGDRQLTEVERQEIAATAEAGARALEELLELHTPAWSSSHTLCRECLTPFPCRSRRLADIIAGTPAPPQEGSQ
jgi:hypothetical protein